MCKQSFIKSILVLNCILCLMLLSACGGDKSSIDSASDPILSAETTTTLSSESASTATGTITLGWSVQSVPTASSQSPQTSTATATQASPPPSSGAAGTSYPVSAEYHDLLSKCVFVGDSICSGLKAYKILPANQVLATGSVGVRSIFDYQFDVNNGKYDIITALNLVNPQYVIFSMGMNDINMSSTEKYCENYKNLLTKAQSALPNAKLYVASITPIAASTTFSTNEKIDTYNQAIQQFLTAYPDWNYVDVSKKLKNEWNALIYNYTSGDGIHLSPAAYTAMLTQVCEQLAAATPAG